ncbi:response regulator [Pseudobacteriovorax antillogorgiicola]|uniref:DNA-binding response regulator, OmpR family, contains REC and winged-helix (WHTH) domain n=1 Tax=Pseudobacteriovorax antillogorgiicola TaxID=1513793 RepID=A0A1Y6B9M2_9BACT|nr:response regulator [Pseudobacteriovorax antillogorgiicola]TCS57516.1 DNA-binding response OmpR family regulator [Pseudobacteriovorax antillogorgiicola]SMF00141.1 DNA-binding response regulator, OmpR family, contains REC and winged-helix (wHTH) domain [Pseudobacteriovorax antillogorgiicola]
MTELLRKILEDEGYRVFEASNGPEAEQVFLDNPHIRLVLCDINLGDGENGFDVLSHIVPKRAERFFKFCFVTASHQEGLRDTALRFGADELIHKPVSPKKLRETIALLMGGANSQNLEEDDVRIKLDNTHGEIVDSPMKPHITILELTRFTMLLEVSGHIVKGYSIKVYSPRLARFLEADTPFFTLRVENTMTVSAARKKAESRGKKLAYEQCKDTNTLIRCNILDLTSVAANGIEALNNRLQEKKRADTAV